jgi:hypothetical protein
MHISESLIVEFLKYVHNGFWDTWKSPCSTTYKVGFILDKYG